MIGKPSSSLFESKNSFMSCIFCSASLLKVSLGLVTAKSQAEVLLSLFTSTLSVLMKVKMSSRSSVHECLHLYKFLF